MIRKIDFSTIYPIWRDKLWPERTTDIETHSAMVYLSAYHSIDHFNLPVWYLGEYIDDILVGVNSGHMCINGMSRSRGLWVDPNYRNRGIGKSLLVDTIHLAEKYDAVAIWSFPRRSSSTVYESAGFIITSDWKKSETSDANAFCHLKL